MEGADGGQRGDQGVRVGAWFEGGEQIAEQAEGGGGVVEAHRRQSGYATGDLPIIAA